MKKSISLFAALCCAFITLLPQKAQAKIVTVCRNGVYYVFADSNTFSKTAEVTCQYDISDDIWRVSNYSGLSGDVNIPSTIEVTGAMVNGDYTITNIQAYAFANKKNGGMIKVTLPFTIERIGYGAFLGATKLYTISLNEGLKELAEDVFSGCTALTEVYLPSTLNMIPNRTFNGCTSLPAIALSAGIEHIGRDAFYGCTA